ncbi:MAG: hypothetical protein VX730_08635 [Pseudomonadota bacterium]|nr:hypothetical protein [Pseudomonadota bacterium]
MNYAKLMAVALATVSLSGCIFGGEANQVSGNFCSPKHFRTVFMNNANIAGLYPEQEAADVLSRMGKPASQSNFKMRNGGTVTAWFYQINIEPPCRGFEGDYKYEPVFLANGQLIGVGHRYYAQHIRPNATIPLWGDWMGASRAPANYNGGFQENF